MLRVFATSAFRLETRQSYADDGEAAAFNEWQECGRVPDDANPLIADWTGLVRAHVESGAMMRRVHVVSHPMTDYVRFELALQQTYSVPAGELTRLWCMTTGEVDAARGVRDAAWAAGADLGGVDVVAVA